MKTRIKIGFFSFCLGTFLLGFTFAASSSTTGSFLTSFADKKAVIDALYDTSYQNVYQQFQSSATSVLKSLNYQSLVCLGVMSDTLFLQQMQTDIKNLKLGFTNAYSRIQSDAVDVEQKHRIESDTNVSLFASGTSYESELARLSSDLASLVDSHKQLAQQFQQSYQSKITAFIKDVADYTQKNQDLVTSVSSKIVKLQSLDQKLQSISTALFNFQANLAGTGSQFFDKIQKVKESSLNALGLSLQDLIDYQVKRTKVLKNLSGELAVQKTYALGLFGMQYDEKLNVFLSQWYDNKDYTSLQSKVIDLKQSYISANKYQCQKFLTDVSFDSNITSLISQLDAFSTRIQSGSAVVKTSTGAATFQAKVLQWFSTVDADQKKSVTTFKAVIQQKTSSLLQEYRNASSQITSGTVSPTPVVTTTSPVVSTTVTVPAGFYFKTPFTSNQKHTDIKILQQLLTNLGYYTGAIDSVYTKSTKNAVYQFQLTNGLLKGYEKRPSTWGWMGPSTRAKLSDLLYK